MKILFVHNFYQLAGGEDTVFRTEIEMLMNEGHTVNTFVVHNNAIKSKYSKLRAFLGIVFSPSVYFKLRKVLLKNRPDVVHVHNYFPLLSPAVFYACNSLKVPVVHTLHNYRAICPTATLMHNGMINEKSILGGPWWTVFHKVYKESILGTFALALMISIHRFFGTWKHSVDAYICLTNFSRQLFSKAGWPIEKLYVKSNTILEFTPKIKKSSISIDFKYAIFVGRLSKEKGIFLLIEAWKSIDFPLIIVGDGPEEYSLKNAPSNIFYLGAKNKDEILNLIKNSQFIIMASTWYEGFPMVLIEAFSQSTCALVPGIGSMAEIIVPEQNGLHFSHNDSQDLSKQASILINNPKLCDDMGRKAFSIFKEQYSEKINMKKLLDIYTNAIKSRIKIER